MNQPSRIRILYLAANPWTTDRLSLDVEVRNISELIARTPHREVIDFQTRWAVRPNDLHTALLEVRPHVVHFSGHGTPHGKIVLDHDTHRGKLVEHEALAELIGILKDSIRLVLLNACYSHPLARALTRHIDCAIGVEGAVHDQAAIEFAAAFYQAIGFGCPVSVALQLGRNALSLQSISLVHAPEIAVRDGADPAKIILIDDVLRSEDPDAPRARPLGDVLVGEWRIEITSTSGGLREAARMTLSEPDTFIGALLNGREQVRMAGRWRVLENGLLELRGAAAADGKGAAYVTALRFHSVSASTLRAESTQGEQMTWRRVRSRP